MGIKRRKSSEWTDVTVLKRCTGSGWIDITTSRRYNGREWVPLWRPSGTYTGTYAPTEYASYYMAGSERITSGIPEAGGMPVIIQGSGSGRSDSIVSTMIFFPIDDIREDLYDAQIISVSLSVLCVQASTRITGAYLLLHCGGGLDHCPEEWDGSDGGDADTGTPRVYENETFSVALNNAVAEGMRDGTVKYLAFNAAGLPDYRYFGLFDASCLRLNIQYKYI